VFAPTLFDTKLARLAKYGTLATEYTQSFHQKWIIDRRNQHEVLLGTENIQSLADLGKSFSFIEKMKILPMASRTPVHLALACVIPMAPLLLTMMPLKDILELLSKLFSNVKSGRCSSCLFRLFIQDSSRSGYC
jgi:hypothetical protein